MHIFTFILINFDHKLIQYNLTLLDQDKHFDIFVLYKFGANDLLSINLSNLHYHPFVSLFGVCVLLRLLVRLFSLSCMFYTMMVPVVSQSIQAFTCNGLTYPHFNDFFVGAFM